MAQSSSACCVMANTSAVLTPRLCRSLLKCIDLQSAGRASFAILLRDNPTHRGAFYVFQTQESLCKNNSTPLKKKKSINHIKQNVKAQRVRISLISHLSCTSCDVKVKLWSPDQRSSYWRNVGCNIVRFPKLLWNWLESLQFLWVFFGCFFYYYYLTHWPFKWKNILRPTAHVHCGK